ncbi:hypothetical protein WN943_012464 [Citrus x changshan-huyou]
MHSLLDPLCFSSRCLKGSFQVLASQGQKNGVFKRIQGESVIAFWSFHIPMTVMTESFVFLDFLSVAFAFSVALLFSLNLALPRLPSIPLFFARSFSIKLTNSSKISMSPLPVFWSIGSRPKLEKMGNSGCWVQAYINGNVYDGEYNKGNGDVYEGASLQQWRRL